MTKTVKSLSIHDIKPISKNSKGFSGGLEDLGNFKEGFCWKVLTSEEEEWVMCSDNLEAKENFMEALTTTKGAATVFAKPDKELEGEATIDAADFSGAPEPY